MSEPIFNNLKDLLKETEDKEAETLLKNIMAFTKKCEDEKLAKINSFSTEELRIKWCMNALVNAATSLLIVTREQLTKAPETEDLEVSRERLENLAAGYSHVLIHMQEFMSIILYQYMFIVAGKKVSAEISELEKLYGQHS